MRCHTFIKFFLGAVLGFSFATGVWAKGTLRYATVGEPPSLDQHVVTSDLATTIAHHVFEGLYTFNGSYAPAPLLVASERVQDGGKTVTLVLRKGVKFHNGAAMTSADVVASLKRWGEHGSRGKVLFENVDSVRAKGTHQVTIHFKRVFGPWKNLMAFINGGPAIYPKTVASGAGKKPISTKQYIGTGPYQFKQWRPNRYVEITKYKGYRSPKGKADGYAGARVAHFDAIRFIPVPDVGTRVNGLKAGDYDYAESIPGDLYNDLSKDRKVSVVLNGGAIFGLVYMNSKEGPLKKNFALRRAIQTALNKEEALRVSIGPKKLWAANGSFLPQRGVWGSKAGIANFSRGDVKAARKMAKAAGYKGEPIKFMVSTNYVFHYDQAVVFTKQLAEAGFNIDLQVYDWATLIKKRAQPDQWDMFFTHHGFVPDPILLAVVNDNYPGWWKTKEKDKLKGAFTSTTNQAKRRKIWSNLQALIYEQVPTMKTGDVFTYNIASKKLKGMQRSSLIWPHFWGVRK